MAIFQLFLLSFIFLNSSAEGPGEENGLPGEEFFDDFGLLNGLSDYEPETRDQDICKNTNDGELDNHGYDCAWYSYNPWDCGIAENNNEKFDSMTMCCACGGGVQQNAIYGQIIFDTSKCSNLDLNRGFLYDVLAPHFSDTEGIDILKINDQNAIPEGKIGFEIDISLDGLSTDDLLHDFESIKKMIQNSIPCDDIEGIDLSNFETLSSETLTEAMEPDETDLHPDIVTNFMDFSITGENTDAEKEIIIPQEKSYRNLIGDVRNQGRVGSCLAFAIDGLTQFYEKRDNDITQEFSPKYFYYHRLPSLIASGIPGMYMRRVSTITKTAGNVPESSYPYKDVKETEGKDKIPQDVQTLGAEYAENNYATDAFFCTGAYFHTQLPDFKLAMQSYLAIYGVCVITVPVYHFGCDMWKKVGQRRGGHAMLVDGYNDDGLQIRNSWGQDWCEGGYTTMSWQDAHDRSYRFCFWKKPVDSRMIKFNYRTIKVESDCLVERDVTYDGGDLESTTNVDSSGKCANLCYNTPRCITWTYKSQTCHMKNKYRYNKKIEEGAVSGLPCSKILTDPPTLRPTPEPTPEPTLQPTYDSRWKVILAKGIYTQEERFADIPKGRWQTIDLGSGEINRRIKSTSVRIIRRTCLRCVSTHKTIYYKRLTDDSRIDYRNLLVIYWSSRYNILNRDFKMYSSLEDLKSDSNAWQACVYDRYAVGRPVGFPFDCGPTRYTAFQWNSWPNVNGWTRQQNWIFEYFDDSNGPL